MRNANTQRKSIMLSVDVLQQAPCRMSVMRRPRAGNAAAYEGQRCALLTTKSRNTCTRATVFSSSG
jgi:hypothetical protein